MTFTLGCKRDTGILILPPLTLTLGPMVNSHNMPHILTIMYAARIKQWY